MSSKTISTYLVLLVSFIFTFIQSIIIHHYNRMRILLSIFAKYWTEYSIFSSKISSAKLINSDYENYESQSALVKNSFDFEESKEIYDSVAPNFNYILKIEQELNKPRKYAASLMSSIEIPFRDHQFSINQNVFNEDLTFTHNKSNKKIYDHRAEQTTRKHNQYQYISNTWLKLDEYNEKNNDYLRKKIMLSNTNLYNIYPFTSFSNVPRLSKTGNSPVRGIKVASKSNRLKLYKSRQFSFIPTELSIIFENLAY